MRRRGRQSSATKASRMARRGKAAHWQALVAAIGFDRKLRDAAQFGCWRTGRAIGYGGCNDRYRRNCLGRRAAARSRLRRALRHGRADHGHLLSPVLRSAASRADNVRFFADGLAARAAGLARLQALPPRRCRRATRRQCWRRSTRSAARQDARRSPRWALIVGYSPAHFQRVFKRAIGLSPAAYARACAKNARAMRLSDSESVTGAIYEAGYGSASRFYENTKGRLGMTASAWANGGAGVTINWAVVETTSGADAGRGDRQGRVPPVVRGGREQNCAPLSARRSGRGRGGLRKAARPRSSPCSRTPGSGAHIPLDVKGTAFQEACWDALRAIPPGETRTYAEIAAAAGNPKAVRAAGSANGVTMWPC